MGDTNIYNWRRFCIVPEKMNKVAKVSTKEYDVSTGRIIDPEQRKALFYIDSSEDEDLLVPLLRGMRFRMLGITRKQAEAMELVRKHKVGVLFIDDEMPGLNIEELLTQIQRRHPDFHVILFGTHITKDKLNTAVKLGAVGYLSKPLQKQAVQKMMGRVI